MSDSLISEILNTTERFVNNTSTENDVLVEEELLNTVTDENIQTTEVSFQFIGKCFPILKHE